MEVQAESAAARLIGCFRDVKALPKLLLEFESISALMLLIGVSRLPAF